MLRSAWASSSWMKSCLFHIQQSPHCFDSLNKKTIPLHTNHTTPNTIEHTNYIFQTCKMSQISQLSFIRLRPSHNQTCCLDTLEAKASFLLFLPAPDTKQTWRQYFVADIIYHKSGFGCADVSGPSTREVGCGGGLAASYTWTSTDSDSTVLSTRLQTQTRTDLVRTHLVSLIHNSQFRCTERNGAELPAKSQSSSRRCRYKSACFLRYVVGSAVIASGAHVATVCSDWLWCARDCGGSGGQCSWNW